MGKFKYVSVKACIGTIILCIICCATAFIPYSISNKLVFAFEKLPLVGDGTLVNCSLFAGSYANKLIGISSDIWNFIYSYNCVVLFAFLLVDILGAILVASIRKNGIRKAFRIISIVFASLMILINITFLVEIVFSLLYFFDNQIALNELWNFAIQSGFLIYLGLTIVSFILIFAHFNFFTIPYQKK